MDRSVAGDGVERKLSIPVSLLQGSKHSIWNTCYLECLLFGILLYSTSFTKFYYGFTKIAGSVITYILQISLVYLEQSITSHPTQNVQQMVLKSWRRNGSGGGHTYLYAHNPYGKINGDKSQDWIFPRPHVSLLILPGSKVFYSQRIFNSPCYAGHGT
jgi:hypothetical protein